MSNVLNILDKDTGKYVGIPALKGESAYEVAVKNGYKGTEREWLESLKGEGADVDLTEYATISYVDEAIENVEVSLDGINLEGIATEEWTKEYINDNLETIANGFYESTSLKGEDITDDIIAANGELPYLPVFQGGTKYIVNGGVTNILINPKVNETSLYINDYVSMDSNQKFEIMDTDGGIALDYFVYGAYNKDLLSKKDLVEPAKTMMNRYVNFNTTDQYFPSGDRGIRLLCGWAFYGKESFEHEQWLNKHISLGTVSQEIQDVLDKLPNTDVFTKYSDASPGAGYRKYPALVIPVNPYTTYTINYTGDTEGDKAYLNGIHYCLVSDDDFAGGGCSTQPTHHIKHLCGIYTDTFTTGSSAKYLVLSVNRMKSTNADFSGVYTNLTTDSSYNADIEMITYIINNFSVVEGAQTYEYYIDMIKDIDFTLSITAMNMSDETQYSYYNITIPYVMKSNQYFRFNREKDIFTVSRPLVKAVGMQIDKMNDTNLNYSENEVGIVGRWIDSKDIYRTVLRVTLPALNGGSSFGNTSIDLQDVIDTVVDMRATMLLPNHGGTTPRQFLGNSYAYITANTSYFQQNFRMNVETVLPTDESIQFRSTLYINYGSYYVGEEIAVILEYTKYDYQEDGTIV